MEITSVLMAEHRLIERMVSLMEKELRNEALSRTANPMFIYASVDFFRNYTDKTHHGKEEGILFRELAKKQLMPEHRKVVEQLVREHNIARGEVKQLFEAAQRYERGDMDAIAHISTHLKRLVALYPPHIALEDKQFFGPAMGYFSPEEKKRMLDECHEYDAGMAHAKYIGMVEGYESV
ncbi:MAG: hemerythrin domain-containing protein [Candidatus Micrarchaeia archaeon]